MNFFIFEIGIYCVIYNILSVEFILVVRKITQKLSSWKFLWKWKFLCWFEIVLGKYSWIFTVKRRNNISLFFSSSKNRLFFSKKLTKIHQNSKIDWTFLEIFHRKFTCVKIWWSKTIKKNKKECSRSGFDVCCVSFLLIIVIYNTN